MIDNDAVSDWGPLFILAKTSALSLQTIFEAPRSPQGRHQPLSVPHTDSRSYRNTGPVMLVVIETATVRRLQGSMWSTWILRPEATKNILEQRAVGPEKIRVLHGVQDCRDELPSGLRHETCSRSRLARENMPEGNSVVEKTLGPTP